MTDIISSIKIQKTSLNNTRKVCLQQSRNTPTTINNTTSDTQISSNFLLVNNNITSINNHCVQPSVPPPLSCFLKSTQNNVLLKSSLKHQRSTSAIAKSVRFNMPLAQILHFYTPPMEEEEEEEDDDDYYDEDADEEEEELEDPFLELFSKRLSTSDYDSNLYHPAIQQHILNSSLANKLTLVLSNWPSADPTKRFITQIVSLENLSWENARRIIKGRVLVHNLAYEKRVMIRSSFDHWQTWMDVDTTYKESSNGNALDRFTFEIITPDHLSYMNQITSNSQCSLAVRYQVNGGEFWDNNSGNNFNVQWTSSCDKTEIGEQEEKTKENVNTKKARQNQVISFNQQGKSSTTTTIGYQEEEKRKIKKKEYYIPLSNNQTTTDLYITPINEQHKMDCFSSSTTQQQISAHFQLYLERKRRSEERQKECSHLVADQHSSTTVSLNPTPSSPLLIPPNRNELVLLI